jgi:phospholipid/cholesterol/gamma-HCH transport system permease protein
VDAVATLKDTLEARGRDLRESVTNAGFTVSLLLQSLRLFFVDLRHRRRFILDQLAVCGISPLPVVCVVGLFTGMLLALQIGMELSRLGQSEAISNMIGLILFREMGPFMTAMILTASVGSAMAAELGTMRVSEEIDALECMSINTTSFLVMPRIVAMTIMTPLLTFIGCILGCVGGGLVANTQLSVSPAVYARNLLASLQAEPNQLGPLPEEIYTGLIKAAIFGALIATISCATGLKASGGAIGVGRAVRSAVVRCFLMLIIIGYYISWIFFR